MPRKKLIFAWSGGKDSAMALYTLKKGGDCEVAALLNTVNADYDRSCMHGIRRPLIEEQSLRMGLPLEKVYLGRDSSNEEYEAGMAEVLGRHKKNGVLYAAFGDIFLEDLKIYREKNLAGIGMKGLFPVWKKDSVWLANEFIALGFKAFITCVDSKALGGAFCGRQFDGKFLSDLPEGVDPCGENGEFHTFVYDGPLFSSAIDCKKGEVVLRDGRYYFCDIVPAVSCPWLY